ncbi:MAG TPA: Ku protein [Candidatus Sulfotelmatobacter sp.]|nr:Ku protein [Candidatus Sulfotelmatobacter sp.]
MASIWSGSITFGLIVIPVAIHGAVESAERVRFRLLHRKDRAPIKHKNFCSVEDIEVGPDEIVRGYEVSKGQYALVEAEELQKVQAQVGEGDRSIEILQFAELSALDPLLVEKPYYLVPQKEGGHAYAVLRDALAETRRIGMARFYLRTKPLLAALIPGTTALSLAVLRPFEELRNPADLPVPADKPKPAELKMARMLIDEMMARWDPTQHPNEYRRALEELLAAKRTFALAAAPAKVKRGENVVDLMAALKKSLQSTQTARGRGKKTTAARSRRAA